VDFSRLAVGTKVYLVNVHEHQTGIGANREVPLGEVLSEQYKAVLQTQLDGKQQWVSGDPTVGPVLQLVVKAYTGVDKSMNPADYEPARPGKVAGKKMIPLWLDRNDPNYLTTLQNARRREFKFGRSSGTDENPWTIKNDGDEAYFADPRRVTAAPRLATGPTAAGYAGETTTEVWKLTSGGGWSHPVHVHFEEGIILTRGGVPPPEWEKWARKDIYRIGGEDESTQEVELAIKFREFAGTYVEHCHNTQHEDTAMLMRWDLEKPGQFLVMPTPLPTWEGVEYVQSVGVPTFRSGTGIGPVAAD
jgi:manganese oxidase